MIYFRKFWFATKWSTQPINEGNDIIIPIEKMQTYSNTFCAIIYRCKLSCNVLVLYVLIVRNNTRFVCTVLWTLSFSSRHKRSSTVFSQVLHVRNYILPSKQYCTICQETTAYLNIWIIFDSREKMIGFIACWIQ